MKIFFKRILGGIGILALVLIACFIGGYVLDSVILVISSIALKEYFDAIEFKNFNPSKFIVYIFTFLFFILDAKYNLMIIYFLLLILLIDYVFSKRDLIDIILSIFGFLYIPFLFNYFILLNGRLEIYLLFIIPMATDSLAYVIGVLFGRHKLMPEISPKKTIEGFLGGIFGAIVIGSLFIVFIMKESIFLYLPLLILASIIGQIGDLVASKIKRYTGIKDFGYLILGHGGILDRFDSILTSAPFIYYYLSFIKR